MSFEMAASRILAPTIGSSTYIWTSVIGVIIAALSLGYWLGGKLADRRHQAYDVALLLLISGGLVLLMTTTYQDVLAWLAEVQLDDRLRGVIASLLLFAPTSLVLGAVSPYLAKLNVTSLDTSGTRIANLSALNSLGGITGTFLTGFWLFAILGSQLILVILGISLVVMSFVLAPRVRLHHRVIIAVALVIVGMMARIDSSVISVDTPSAHYTITTREEKGQQYRLLASGPNGIQSGTQLGDPSRLVFWYTQEIARQVSALPTPRSILILGGGAYSMPQYFAKAYPDARIDVVEIDPQLAHIARQYFEYSGSPRIREIDADARVFLNHNTTEYDIVVVDVYGDMSVPFSLSSREYGQLLARATASDGVVLANMIGGRSGACREMYEAAAAAYAEQFEYLYARANPTTRSTEGANTVTLMSRHPLDAPGYTRQHITRPAYNDDFNPVEPLQQGCLNANKAQRV